MKKILNWRTNLIFIFFILFAATIISRLFFLQVLDRKLYGAQALGQQVNFDMIAGARGQILCTSSQKSRGAKGDGEVKSFAINREQWTVSANVKEVSDKEYLADQLSGIMGESREYFLALLNSESPYVVLREGLTSEELNKIKKLNPDGLSWQNVPERFYPQGLMASQTLGFLGGEGTGQYGFEGFYENVLQGKAGVVEQKSGLDSLFSGKSQSSLNGSDIYLTIDYNIQFQAENLLKEEQEKNNIDSGQIIVIKPDSGRIVALANFPNFNPNEYSQEKDLAIFQNSAVQKLFEPGSIMKPLTMAAAINEGKITPDTKYIDTGVVKFGTKKIQNFANEVYGEQTMTKVLENSINTGAVFAEQQVGHKTFFEYVEKFGFTSKTGIDIQGEAYSRNEGLRNGPDMNYATASFGQGIELTPIQFVRGFCAIANGGKLVKPYLAEKIVSGNETIYTQPEISKPIISQHTTSQVTSMLINVVENGLDKAAKIPGYYLAGKTGTAQVPLQNKKGYEPDKTIQSFIGFGPALNPQFLILVKLDNPKVPKSALSAVPVFRKLAQYIINYWQIPPDYAVEQLK